MRYSNAKVRRTHFSTSARYENNEMKLFGMFGKDKPVAFPEFRDMVRQAVRRARPDAVISPIETGLRLTEPGQRPIDCNLKNLYSTYAKSPGEADALIKQWMDTLIAEVPEHTWLEAQTTLRPMLRSADYIKLACAQMGKTSTPDNLPAEPFLGELHATVVREVGSTLTGVTQLQLESWGVGLHEAMQQAVNNMSMMGFPRIANEFRSGKSEVVGLVFEDNHLTATWLLLERFRDYVGMRLQHDYIVSVPTRSRLVAVRADEAGLIAPIVQSNRNAHNLPYFLTGQCYHVSAATTGGKVTVYQASLAGGAGEGIAASSIFSSGIPASPVPSMAQEMQREQEKSPRFALTEPTDAAS